MAFAIYYNQTRVGRLEISPGSHYSAELPEVLTNVKIDWARFFGFDELTEFLLNAIASHVAYYGPKSDEYKAARLSIASALTRALWDNYYVSQYGHADDVQWGELSVSFHGTAFHYFDRRDAPARPGSR